MNNGGPAFPTDTEHQSSSHTMHLEGMSLRDYFAAKFAATLITPTSEDADFPNPDYLGAGGVTCKDMLARISYEFADAMLKARQQPDATEGGA